MLNDKPQWVAAYTEPRSEKKVAMRLGKMAIEHYLPLIHTTHQWSDRVKHVETPLFSGYIFIKMVRRQVELVRAVPGVVRIVAWNYEPAIIPDREIEFIRAAIDKREQVELRAVEQMHSGVRVRVNQGPFEGMEGVLLDDGKGCKFGIRIEVLNTFFITEMDRSDLTVV